MPFGFHLAMDTLPSGELQSGGFRSALAVSGFRLRARLGFSIPSSFSGQRGITPAFGYSAPHPSAGGTSTLLNNALLSEVAHKVALTLATVRRSNVVCGFPAPRFHEDTDYEIRRRPYRVGPAPHLSG